VILGTQEFIRGTVEPYLKHTGGAMSPFTAWLMVKGLETMDLRVRAQTFGATRIADGLIDHPKLTQVIYPGHESHPQHSLTMDQLGAGGTVLAIDSGSQAAAFKLMNALEIILISNNLGDAKSIATHPTTTTHQRLTDAQRAELGITPGLIRLSIGLEDPSDLLADLTAALDAV